MPSAYDNKQTKQRQLDRSSNQQLIMNHTDHNTDPIYIYRILFTNKVIRYTLVISLLTLSTTR